MSTPKCQRCPVLFQRGVHLHVAVDVVDHDHDHDHEPNRRIPA